MELRLAPGDWRPVEGESAGQLIVRIAQLAETDDPEWVLAYTWQFPSESAPAPDLVRYLVRWSSLPERVQWLLPAKADGSQAG